MTQSLQFTNFKCRPHSRFLPNSSHFEQKLLREVLQRLNPLRFGSFGKLNLREDEYRSLDHLNLSALFEFVSLFWYRLKANAYFDQKMFFYCLLTTHRPHTHVRVCCVNVGGGLVKSNAVNSSPCRNPNTVSVIHSIHRRHQCHSMKG